MYGQNPSQICSSQVLTNKGLQSETPRPITDIESAFSRLSDALGESERKLNSLRLRLQPVLQEVPASPNKDGEVASGSQLSQEIESRTQAVKQINRELTFILDSLQL